MISPQVSIDDRPGKQEDGLHIEEDEEHGDHIEADREASAGVALGHDAAFIGFQLRYGAAVLTDKKGAGDHGRAQSDRDKDLQQ